MTPVSPLFPLSVGYQKNTFFQRFNLCTAAIAPQRGVE
jgi:hypothetical protein